MGKSLYEFFVPAKKLEEVVNARKIDEYDFTIFSQSFCAKNRSTLYAVEGALEIYPKVPIRNLVCMYPERLLQNEVMAQLQANVQLDLSSTDEEETFRTAYTAVQKRITKKEKTECCQSINELYTNLKDEISNFFEYHSENEPFKSALLSDDDIKFMQKIYEEITSKNTQISYSCLKAMEQRALAHIYTRQAQAQIEVIVKKHITALCAENKLKPLGVQKENTVAVFTTGGVASGKSSCLKNIESSLQTNPAHPVLWSEIVHHNSDRFKTFLLMPRANDTNYSQFTYDEAILVKERSMQIIKQRTENEKGYPHVLFDQTRLKADELKEATKHYQKIIVAAISTDAETALQRSFQRGKQTQRFETTANLLSSHQDVPGAFMSALQQDEVIGHDIEVVMYDNNTRDTSSLRIFATIDMSKKEIYITNEDDMLKWIKKENINIHAKGGDTLYSGARPRSVQEYFTPLIEKGFSLKFSGENAANVVNPNTTQGTGLST